MPSEHQKKRAAKKKEMAKVKRKILDISKTYKTECLSLKKVLRL